MPYSHPDYEKNHFNRSPSWRFDRACRLVENGSRLDPRRDDRLTLRAAMYVCVLCSSDRQEEINASLQRDYPELHAAHRLHDHGGDPRWELEARLLARQTSREIAEAIPLDASVIDAYEATFFNVRDRLDATDWVAGKVIGPGPRRGFANDLPGLWKAVAYAGGPLPLEVVMACTSASPKHRFPADLLNRARRLVEVLMLPADAPLSQILELRERAGVGLACSVRASTARTSILDDIAALAGEAGGRARPAGKPRSDASAPASPPELGKTTNRGTTGVAA